MASLWAYVSVFLLRPLLAVSFAVSLVLFSWWVAWRTVLVHVPLVQEIFGLRKKPAKPKAPASHRLSRFYSAAASRNSRAAKDVRHEDR